MQSHFTSLPRTKAVLQETHLLATRFATKGYKVYLVGGGVRELALGNSVGEMMDLDLATSARPEQVKTLLKNFVESLWAVGERFGTIGCIHNDRTYEITTFRKELYAADSRKPRVNFGTNIEEDLQRRDFTVNAMALSLPDGNLIDPFDGQADLHTKKLRAPIDPRILFDEDPLRILRAARFEAQLGFQPDFELATAMEEMKDRLKIVSRERQFEEIKQILCLPDPAAGLIRLKSTGIIGQLIAAPTDRAIGSLVKVPADFHFRLAALLVEPFCELAMTNNANKSGGDPSSQNTNRGKALLGPPLCSLTLPKRTAQDVVQLLSLTCQAIRIEKGVENWNETKVRSLARQAKTIETMDKVLTLLEIYSPQAGEALNDHLLQFKQAKEDPFNPEIPLTSQEIIDIFGIAPGPKVGEAQKVLAELYLQKGRLSKRQAIRQLKKRLF